MTIGFNRSCTSRFLVLLNCRGSEDSGSIGNKTRNSRKIEDVLGSVFWNTKVNYFFASAFLQVVLCIANISATLCILHLP